MINNSDKLCDFHERMLILCTGVQLFRSSYYGQGTGPIVFADLNCDGSESKLEDCSFSSTTYNYSHYNYVGLHCYEKGRL